MVRKSDHQLFTDSFIQLTDSFHCFRCDAELEKFAKICIFYNIIILTYSRPTAKIAVLMLDPSLIKTDKVAKVHC